MTLSGFPPSARRVGPGLTGALLHDLLGAFPHIRLSVTGGCMRPLLAPGDRVVIAGTASRPARLGDVVLVQHRHGLRLHRLVWAAGRAWRTKGDRSLHFDPRVSPERVLGVVVGVEDGRDVRRGWRRATLRSLCGGAWAARAPLRRASRILAWAAAMLSSVGLQSALAGSPMLAGAPTPRR